MVEFKQYRDGGTIEVVLSDSKNNFTEQSFFIDGRINSSTKGLLFKTYPKPGFGPMSNIEAIRVLERILRESTGKLNQESYILDSILKTKRTLEERKVTDLEKTKDLFDQLGIEYEEYEEKENQIYLKCVAKRMKGVTGYTGFLVEWVFKSDGTFATKGIWEE